jgi:tetratricopeptide (TPR) repeat protein
MEFKPEDHIPEYLSGDLEGEELRLFEQALEVDGPLRMAVDLQRRVEYDLAHREEIKSLLKEANDTHPLPKKTKATNRNLPMWIGVAALVVIALGLWYTLDSQRESPEILADRFLQENLPESVLASSSLPSRQGVDTLREDTSDEGEDLTIIGLKTSDSARHFLINRDYSTALNFYKRIDPNSATDSLRFERAILLLRASDPVAAMNDLEDIERTFSGGLYWYKALAHLKLGDTDEAQKELDKITEMKTSPYAKGAQQLSEQL